MNYRRQKNYANKMNYDHFRIFFNVRANNTRRNNFVLPVSRARLSRTAKSEAVSVSSPLINPMRLAVARREPGFLIAF